MAQCRAMSDWFKVRRLAVTPKADGEWPSTEKLAAAGRFPDAGDGGPQFKAVKDGVWRITYDLRETSLAEIETALKGSGMGIAPGWWQALRNLCIRYCETIQRDTRDVESGWDAYVRAMYISRYRSRRHGRIDDRPQQWRGYLADRQD